MKDALKNAFEPLISSAGAHLVDVEIRSQGKKRFVEVFVDTETGITADELAKISRLLGEAIEKGDLVQDAYTLVVSSPGLDRPVRHPWQFQRHMGRIVQVRWTEQNMEQEFTGEIINVSDKEIVLREGEVERKIPHEAIVHAMIQIIL